ncbi:DUF5682 family protein [Streptomyces sp. NPDC059161]|uniref:DUF5682 family protein n=1 Tax=Streptomyces sp. NPDC059161 TaxID=3346749 RepID=UPI00369AE94B
MTAPPGVIPARSEGPLLLGVRHHGPGSARAVRNALDAAQPRAVLIEGPPEGDALLGLAGDVDMRPPVALLAHVVDDPGRAAFWPMAEFSPEWVSIRWALEHGAQARFIDLPAAHSLAAGEDGEGALRIDPLGVLAEAAGYDDPERWWEDVVEHRAGPAAASRDAAADPRAPFAALAEAMAVLRETYGDGGHPRDLVREAHMRQQLRAATREFGDAIAVVCGAWHVPALAGKFTVAGDRALLKGLPKVKAELTWVPWTNRRLARHSGYGAGIDSPGWYGHLFGAPDRPVERWMTKVAGLLREEDRQVSPAHVIEAVRLAGTLAALRGRPLPGLAETTDAVRAVLCEGSDVPLALIQDRLIVGDVLGEVPDAAPAVPLQRDLVRAQRALRLKPQAAERELELDLRKETDAARSRLLHRLRLLGIGWGEQVRARSTGTFRESWRLRWEPELSVRVAEAGVWGTTVLSAATAKTESDAVAATALVDITALAERCLLAELPDALPVVMRALADRAALDTDVAHLAQALPALARTLRYGDVRGTATAGLAEVAAGLAERICVGLPPACAALGADGAAEMRDHLDAVHAAMSLLVDPAAADPAATHAATDRAALGPDPAVAEPSTGPAATGSGPDADAAPTSPAIGGPTPDVTDSGPAGAVTEPALTGPAPAPAGPAPAVTGTGPAATGSGPDADAAPTSPAIGGPAPDVTDSGPAGAVTEPALTGPAPAPAGPAPAVTGTGPAATNSGPGPRLIGSGGLRVRWFGVLGRLARWDGVPGGIRGRAMRLLLDDGRVESADAARYMGLALSPGTAPADAAAWIEGFFGGAPGGGMLLVHDEVLLGLLDGWLTGVAPDAFTDVLPLLRRTFAGYEAGVRRTLGELVRRGPAARGGAGDAPVPGFGSGLDAARADAVLPLVALLLGRDQSNNLVGVES